MKTFTFILAMLLAATVAYASEVKYDFEVGGLSCSRDEVCVAEKLKRTPGIIEATVDGLSSSVVVKFDDRQIKLEAVKKAIEDEGYPIRKITPSKQSD